MPANTMQGGLSSLFSPGFRFGGLQGLLSQPHRGVPGPGQGGGPRSRPVEMMGGEAPGGPQNMEQNMGGPVPRPREPAAGAAAPMPEPMEPMMMEPAPSPQRTGLSSLMMGDDTALSAGTGGGSPADLFGASPWAGGSVGSMGPVGPSFLNNPAQDPGIPNIPGALDNLGALWQAFNQAASKAAQGGGLYPGDPKFTW